MIRAWLRGLMLLRHPEVLKDLGERRLRRMALDQLRARFPAARIEAGAELIGVDQGQLELGEGATVAHGTVVALGDSLSGYGEIRIGARSWIGQYNNLRACGDGPITIGEGCLISQFCTLVSSNHLSRRDRSIRDQGPDRSRLGVWLGDDVWLGAGVTVLPGSRLHRGAIVGANSVVSGEVPEYEIWCGSPARKVGERT